jgi:hypothetical protein
VGTETSRRQSINDASKISNGILFKAKPSATSDQIHAGFAHTGLI